MIEVDINHQNSTKGPVYRYPVNELRFDRHRHMRPGNDVFILGFPENLSAGGNFPLWKRGSVASEPDANIDGLPKFLVDTAGRPGMSGSPVIYRGYHRNPSDNQLASIQNFCGIYTGRVNVASGLDTQLGIVWKARVINDIITGEVKDTVYYPGETFTAH